MISSRGQACQVLLSVPNVPFFPSHLLDLSSFPFMLFHSFYCLHIYHSLSHSVYFTPMLTYYATTSSVTLQVLRGLLAVQRHICQDHILPSSVTVSLRRHQKLNSKPLFYTTLEKDHRNGADMETKGHKT